MSLVLCPDEQKEFYHEKRIWHRRARFFHNAGAAGVVGVGRCFYGGLGVVSDVLHVRGVIGDPRKRKWFFLSLVLWAPWWVLGGVLFVATAWFARQRDVEDGASRNTLDSAATVSAAPSEKKV